MIMQPHNLIDNEFDKHVAICQEFLRIRSISSEPENIIKTANWLKNYISKLGFKTEFVGNQDHPIIFAKSDNSKAKTLLVYGMYDVQPVEEQLWSSPPFAANIVNQAELGQSIIARGACNSKAPLIGFLNAISVLKRTIGIPVNLILTFEGEEEIGSQAIFDFYINNKELLKADAAFDPFWAEYGTDVDYPTISLGSKGILVIDLICRGGEWGGPTKYSIHSSVGALVSSPFWRLLKAISTMIDDNEIITVDNFNQQIEPISVEDENLINQLNVNFNEQNFLDMMKVKRFKINVHGKNLLKKYFFTPTISINSLRQIENDVISSVATAELVVRTVPKMSDEEIIRNINNHLINKGFGDIEINKKYSYPYSRTTLNSSVVQSMMSAYKYFSVIPDIRPLSPSATPYYLFSNILNIPYVWGGLGKAGRSHTFDEYCTLDGLKLFEKSITQFLVEFGKS